MSNLIAFTKSNIESIAAPKTKGREYYKDANTGFLKLAVTANGTKSFFVQKKVNGESKRVTLGRFPELTIQNAKKLAAEKLNLMSLGINPLAKERDTRQRLISLKQVFTEYLEATSLKPNTISNYHTVLNKYFDDWKGKPLIEIKRGEVLQKFNEISESYPSSANKAFRVLRSLLNFAMGKYENSDGEPYITSNPVDKLKQLKAWHKESRRSSYINQSHLSLWFRTVLEYRDSNFDNEQLVADFLIVGIMTGLRRNELLGLKVDDISFTECSMCISDTKNSSTHKLPLTPLLESILRKRCDIAKFGYIFENPHTRKNVVDLRRLIGKVREDSGIEFTPHDLRRTFATYAGAAGISELTVKKLMNHKEKANVTMGYVVNSVDSLREPMLAINDYIFKFLSEAQRAVLNSLST
ncbi:MAG: integrase family protein [Gammaproteobacteria bacterium]|nr:integrase family protein [Gammaproteobacteria bacterium]